MYLKRHALQLLVAKRSARQWISKAKRVHYNKYQCFHLSSGLCLFVSQCILCDSPCAEPGLDSIIITHHQKGNGQAWCIFMTSSGCLGNEFCRSLDIQQLSIKSGCASCSRGALWDILWLSGFRWKTVCEQNCGLFTNSQSCSSIFDPVIYSQRPPWNQPASQRV